SRSGAHRKHAHLLSRRRRRRPATGPPRRVPGATRRRTRPPRRRGAGVPRRPHLGNPFHVRAPADRMRSRRGNGHHRPGRACRARARGAVLERRADASRHRVLEPPTHRGRGLRVVALGGGGGPRPPHPRRRAARRTGHRGAVRPASGSRRRGGIPGWAATIPRRRARGPPFPRMKTYSAKPGEISREWYLVDADGQTLGRLATRIAETLRGKGKPQFTPHVDTGDFVIVVNAEKIQVTGNKLDQKRYFRHSNYPGGLRSRTLREQLDRRPEEVIRMAVKGMLPKNRLARQQITKLKIYAGPDHPHAPQSPKPLPLETA